MAETKSSSWTENFNSQGEDASLEQLKGTVTLIHGGYWRNTYGLELMNPLAEHLVSLGWSVNNIEYTRIGDVSGPPWQRMAADVIARCAEASHKPHIVVGHSAGGHLALWAAAQLTTINAVVALAPVADLVAADELNLSSGAVRELMGGSSLALEDEYRLASPSPDMDVPQLLVHGNDDDSVPFALSLDYASAANRYREDVRLMVPPNTGHMDLIDPTHEVWRSIENQLDVWSVELDG